MTTCLKDSPQIYVACLAAYNHGYHHGKWIDCGQDYDVVQDEINEMLKQSPVTELYGEIAEEWAIHDYQGFGSYRVEEWDNIQELCEIGQVLNEDNGELVLELIAHLGTGTTIEDAKQFLEDNYAGVHKDLEDFAYSFFDDCYGLDSIPKHLQYYINFESMGRDMGINDVFTLEVDGDTHVFWNR